MKFLALFIVLGVLGIKAHEGRHFFHKAVFIKFIQSQPKVCADEVGCFEGKYQRGLEKPYEAFYGIPYAEPPVGKLRFEDPLPHSGWYGYWDASYPRSDCLQRNVYIASQPVVGSEDCLYLNVYRPLVRTSEKLPVIVYIHGGSWFTFSSNPRLFGPEYFMDNGQVILVTLNYRLGILGFLCSGDEAVRGNFGLKDQQMALKWVASNIEAFGGNPDSITLVGQSAGAASTHFHMMNPESQAQFHRAVMMSGSALSQWSLYYDNYEPRYRLNAKYAGIENADTASTYELANELKKLDALSFIEATDKEQIAFGVPVTPHRPCIEGDWVGAFIKEDPMKVWTEGRFVQKPILAGYTRDEGVFGAVTTTNSTALEEFNRDIYNILPIALDFPPEHTADVMKFYFGNKDYIDETNAKEYYKMFGERLITQPMIVTFKEYLKYADVGRNPLYLYEFAFEGPYSLLSIMSGKDLNFGVSHSDDLLYLFTMTDFFPPFEANSVERRMADIYVETLVHFASHGQMKIWRNFRPCTAATANPFCDRQVFERSNKEADWDQIMVTVTNQINEEMVDFWNRIDVR